MNISIPIDPVRGPDSGVIQLDSVTRSYPGAEEPALCGFTLAVRAGEFVSLLGPSGSGKTTALRVIAGFEGVDEGHVRIGGRLVSSSWVHVPADQRRVGLVFQDYALFPHLTVLENVGFGLRDGSKADKARRACAVLEMAGLGGMENRYPHELSGGQQQRVALARSLAPNPVALLLDEPFSNLDRQLRNQLRREVRSIVKQAGATAILVTHDREEALAVADRIAIMGRGFIEQIGAPEEVYSRPVSPAVAAAVSPCEVIPGRISGEVVVTEAGRFPYRSARGPLPSGTAVQVLIRAAEMEAAPSPNGQPAHVAYREFRGDFTQYGVRLASGKLVRVRRPSGDPLQEGTGVELAVSPANPVIVFPA